ncbi:TonB-dependent receptor [Phenylobacterium sp.]|uniref:TonB-dependent receptor n=1 Tax=Phenylobacterium sp. TaxID=1871053 RepID=UPI0027345FBE|nr:TonB-dependent receptor [Phenylobacterium sp.]MDP3853261.1 TonB-dependent receptor [Phenylobacterium sp.]
MAYNRARAAAQASLLAIIMAMPASAAMAQTELDELVVTARKRDEALIDVPFSINALSESKMRERGATNIEDLSRNIAGFTVQNLGPGQSQVAIRGISAGQIVRDQPGVKEQVGVYLDESVISMSLFTPDIDLFDLNRVEVLRGPQGTLYGSGSLSGTVRYITNQPNTEGVEGSIEATVNSVADGEMGGDLKGVINLPLGDTAALRIAAYTTKFPGFIDAVQPGGRVNEDVNGGTRTGIRASLLFRPTDNLTITPRILYQTIDVDGFNRVDVFNILGNQYTTTRPAVTLGDLQQFTQLTEKFTDDFLLGDLTIQYEMGDLALTSISSYSDREVLVLRDATALTGSITGGSIGLSPAVYTLNAPLADTTDLKSFTQEVRLGSNDDGPFQWVVGVFYSDVDRDYAQVLDVRGFQALTGIPTAGARAPVDALYFSTVPYTQTQYAVFGEGTWELSERLDVTAGLRYASYEENRVLTFDGIFADTTIGVPGGTEADDFAPRVIVSYKATDNVTVNAQASKGFRLGGINDPLNRPLCSASDFATFNALSKPSFDNETVWNYEAGLKARLAEGRGSLTLAAFYADIENLQATLDAGSCSSRVIVNVPKAKSSGVEAEFSMRLSDNFDVAASASWNSAELTSSVRDATGSPIQGLRDGNRLPTVPEFQAAFSINYLREMENGFTAYSNLTWQYVGDRITQISDQENDPRTVSLFTNIGATTVSSLSFPLELPAYDVANLRVGVRNESWDATLFVNNLTDERAKLSIDRERGLRARYGYQTNQPRTVGVTVRKSF